MKKDITIFISEDAETSKEIMNKYFDKEKVTYAEVMSASNREKVVRALEELEEESLVR